MSLFDALTSYDTAAMCKVAALTLALMALRLVAIPVALLVILADRGARRLMAAVDAVPTDAAYPSPSTRSV